MGAGGRWGPETAGAEAPGGAGRRGGRDQQQAEGDQAASQRRKSGGPGDQEPGPPLPAGSLPTPPAPGQRQVTSVLSSEGHWGGLAASVPSRPHTDAICLPGQPPGQHTGPGWDPA